MHFLLNGTSILHLNFQTSVKTTTQPIWRRWCYCCSIIINEITYIWIFIFTIEYQRFDFTISWRNIFDLHHFKWIHADGPSMQKVDFQILNETLMSIPFHYGDRSHKPRWTMPAPMRNYIFIFYRTITFASVFIYLTYLPGFLGAVKISPPEIQ